MRAMDAVAREVGVEAAYPDTRAGKIAALQARLRTIDSSREWCNDFQRWLVLQELQQLQQDRASGQASGDHTWRRT
jgi:hypothetical protein